MFPGIAVDRPCTTMHTLAMLGEFPGFELCDKVRGPFIMERVNC